MELFLIFANGTYGMIHRYLWCLIDEFCFNHGQAGRFYGKPYERGAYVPAIYVGSNDDAARTIGLMAKRNVQDVKNAIEILMQKWQSFNDSDLFVIGRMILRNANFDENGEVRQRMNVTSSSLYALARLDLLIRNRDAVEFMWTELGDNMENFCYVVGECAIVKLVCGECA